MPLLPHFVMSRILAEHSFIIVALVVRPMTQYKSVLQNKAAVWTERSAKIIAQASSLTGNIQMFKYSKRVPVGGRTQRKEGPTFIHVHKEMEDWRS
jgi:hypothetical protein